TAPGQPARRRRSETLAAARRLLPFVGIDDGGRGQLLGRRGVGGEPARGDRDVLRDNVLRADDGEPLHEEFELRLELADDRLLRIRGHLPYPLLERPERFLARGVDE